MFLLDTPALSEPTKKRPSEGLLAFLELQPQHFLFTSVVVIGELRKGAVSHPDPSQRASLERWIEDDVVAEMDGRILPVTAEIANRWGILCGEAARRGRSLAPIDALIAATAIVGGLAVVTRNEAHFRACGVAVTNPWLA